MLEMKKNCEDCGKELPRHSKEAMICSYEDTYCAECATKNYNICPQCEGDLFQRPTRYIETPGCIALGIAQRRRMTQEAGIVSAKALVSGTN